MNIEEYVKGLYEQTFKEPPDRIVKLADSGSNRQYFRLTGARGNVIGAFHEDKRENEAFLSFTRTFRSIGLPVPEILAEDPGGYAYLLTDLGDQTLFSLLSEMRTTEDRFPDAIRDHYRKVLAILPKFQIRGGQSLDYGKCYPRGAFDRQSMHWDLNYFKYYFLKLSQIPFDEQALEEDFQAFMDFLLSADASFYMYRDFQSRNIMLLEGKPFFIDYQGGRKGPLQYDVASLLYDAKADIPPGVREEMLEEYLSELGRLVPGKREEFLFYYPGFILIRILQALGAYGFRGYYEKKSHFLQSIPYALNNFRQLRKKWQEKGFGVDLPTLFALLDKMTTDARYEIRETRYAIHDTRKANSQKPTANSEKLTVTINSFSYRQGIPVDPTGNGGGFVFDCRALPNPGRIEEYKMLTGKEAPVIDFLSDREEVGRFLKNVTSLVDQSVSQYLEREFQHLSVSFGCTGGQHRSVYCAEYLERHLMEQFDIRIIVSHTNLMNGNE